MDVREFIKQVMAEKSLSSLEVERNCNNEITDSTITRILRGEVNRPTERTLKAIARGLRIPEEEILRVARGFPPAEQWTARSALESMLKVVANPELTEIVKELLKMQPEELQRVAKYIKGRIR